MIEIKPYIEEMFQFAVIFAFTKEQVKEAEKYYKDKFNVEYVEKLTTEHSRGFCSSSNKGNKEIGIKYYSIVFINFDVYKEKINSLNNVSKDIFILSTINHELYHLVETHIQYYVPTSLRSKVQEPGARLMSWVTMKFYEEYERQGFTFEFKTKP